MTATTMTTIDRAAELRALADHIDRYGLADDILGVTFNEPDWDGVAVQVYLPETLAAWVRSLDEVVATGHKNKGSIHLHVTGGRDTLAVQVKFAFSTKRLPDLSKELMRQKLGGDVFAFLPIELPAALGGSR